MVISQASPLKRISLPADDKTDVDIPDNLSKHGPSGELPGGEQGKPPSDDQGKKVLSVRLNGTFPPGKPVIPDQARAKNPSTTTTGTRTRASSAPPKSSSGRSRKVGHAQNEGLLADAFRNAQAQKSSGPDGLSRPNTSPEGHTHAQAPIDLTIAAKMTLSRRMWIQACSCRLLMLWKSGIRSLTSNPRGKIWF